MSPFADGSQAADAAQSAVAAARAGERVNFTALATPGLSLFLIQKRAALTPEKYKELVAEVYQEFEAYTEALLAATPGAARARILHQRMDEAMEVSRKWTISCHKGCSGCCHHEVELTGDEADLLAGVVSGGVPIDRERLAMQARRPRKSPEWAVPLSPDSRCVFLGGDGACRVYEHRPAACRKHVVVSPPVACVTIGANTSPIRVPQAEILLTAALALKGSSFTSLSKSLLRRIAF